MSQSQAPRVKLPDVTPPQAIHPGSNSWTRQAYTQTPTATDRDKCENKPMPPTPEPSPSPAAKPLTTAKKNKPYIQPATPLMPPDHINRDMKNRAVTDPVIPKPLFTSKTSTVNQLRKKYSQTRNKSKSMKDEDNTADRPTSPPPVVSQKASQILGVFPTHTKHGIPPASAPPSTRAPDHFRTSAESTKGRNASPNRQVQSTPVLTRRYLQENHLPAVAVIRTSQDSCSDEKRQPQSTEGMIIGNGSLNPTRLGTYGRTGEIGYVGQNEMHRVLSFSGIIENPDPPLGKSEENIEHDTTRDDWNQNTLRPQYSGEILHPMDYSPNGNAGVWENDPNVGYTLPPFSPFYPWKPPLPPSDLDQRAFSQTSGEVPIVLQKFPGEPSHGSGYTHSLQSQNSWAPSGNGNSFAQASTSSSAAETTPRFPGHTRNNSVPPPPISYPGFQPSGPLPRGLVQMELNLHHHVESCFGSLMRMTTDNTDRTIDKMVRRAEESQEMTEKGLKTLKSEIKDVRKEMSSMRMDLTGALQADNKIKDSIGSLGKKLNDLDKKIGEIATLYQRAAAAANETEREECSTYSQGDGSPRRRSRRTHASALSRQEYRQQYTSGTTSGSASTQDSVTSSRGLRSNTTSNGAAARKSDEQSGRKEVFAHFGTSNGAVPDIRDHPAYRGVAETHEPSSPIYQTPNYSAIWYQQAHGNRP
ncbi:MAG: hypothetical protein Q9166_003435 [cf. Caloplaca sp. 2 TL-2023]